MIEMKVTNQATHENLSICAKCGGKCCKHVPCGLLPQEIKDFTIDGITKLLDKGIYSVTTRWGDDEYEVYMIRHRMKPQQDTYYNSNRIINPEAWWGECMLLTENGCSLTFEERPYSARIMVPNKDFKCSVDKDILSAEMETSAWNKPEYQSVMQYIWDNYEEKEE